MKNPLTTPRGLTIPAGDMQWTAVRSSGPGGQNVNKVSTRVELRFDLPNTLVLSVAVKARLRRLARGYLDSEGRILVSSQETRSRRQNLELARLRLAELVDRALPEPKRRVKTRPSKGATERRLAGKRHRSERKRSRGGRGLDDEG
jgi:ribosome-associated protein